MTTPQYDQDEMERDDAEAARSLPGPDYYAILAVVHATLRPRTYLEIGVLHGASLRLASTAKVAVGVDPEAAAACSLPAHVRIARCSSNDFFASEPLDTRVDFAFLDGMHLFEQTVADFINVEAHAAPGAVVAIHDTIPLDERTATRARTTDFYTGDVWKVLVWLNTCRPDLDYITVPAAPAGLTLVRGLSAAPLVDMSWIVDLPWSYWTGRRSELLHLIPNTPDAVIAWLTRASTPPSSRSAPTPP